MLFAFGRMVGFVLFAAVGLGLLGVIVLVPAYARAERARYERDCAAGAVARLEAEASTKVRLAKALPHDRTLTIQLMALQAGRQPAGERVLAEPAAGRPTLEQMIRLPESPPPAPPDGPVIATAERLKKPAMRRGVFLLSAMSLATALLLFAPPSCRREQHGVTAEDREPHRG